MATRKQPDRDARREAAYRRLGTRTPRCAECAETDPLVLTGTTPDILCYGHRRLAQGDSPDEDHHPAGDRNSPLRIRTPGNDHRFLSDAQRDWPERTLRNPDGSPLLKIAALVRGLVDYLRLLLERGLAWIPPALEWLDDLLRRAIGERWWEQLGWDFPR